MSATGSGSSNGQLASTPAGATLGIVVIGRNEGERLRACLGSLASAQARVVYVDSASTDDSLAIARAAGAEAVELDMSRPFSAGRARNAGFERLRELEPNVRYVQFVDGDCVVVPGWLDAALAHLEAEPRVAVVCGRRRERDPSHSIYNALCDIEWDTPVGVVHSCGGDAMMRAGAFADVGGFDPSVVAGEEPELCVRLRAQGWQVVRLPIEMTLHDAAMTRFSQWWKRTVRSGHARAEMVYLHGREPGHPGVRQTVSNLAWSVVLPSALGLGLRGSAGVALGASIYGGLAGRIYLRQLKLGRTQKQALLYAAACTVGKLPETLGAARFAFGVVTGRRSRIIEYK